MPDATYVVPPLGSRDRTGAAPAAPGAKPPVAILVAHGMGQQIPFQTLDAVAEGLRRLDPHADWHVKPVARTIIAGDERLSRLELRVRAGAHAERQVHIYEAY